MFRKNLKNHYPVDSAIHLPYNRPVFILNSYFVPNKRQHIILNDDLSLLFASVELCEVDFNLCCQKFVFMTLHTPKGLRT